jgi:hypothetical protein
MSRVPATFRQSDLIRAVKAALACGLHVVRTEIGRDGRIVLVHAADEQEAEPVDELEAWRAKRDARSAQGY